MDASPTKIKKDMYKTMYKVHLYYGGEMPNRTVTTLCEKSAQNYVDSAEHGEIETIKLSRHGN